MATLASVTSRAGKSGDAVHDILDAAAQRNRAVSHAIVEKVPVHGGTKSKETSGESEVHDGTSEADKGNSISCMRCLVVVETHDSMRFDGSLFMG